ncbi:MAG: sulfotransferase family protein [Mycobacteriales bacterium]
MIFVGGLHRSGTSVLARVLSAAPGAAGLTGTGVPEDEGQHLQSVYPPALAFGGPGRFALKRGAHLTEVDAAEPHQLRESIERAWQPYWSSADALVHVEKSPPNLIRMRYLQTVFPGAAFIVVVRHPVPVALATRKMSGRATLPTLIQNWFSAHRTLERDLPTVDRLLVLTYASLVAGTAWPVIEDFTGLEVQAPELDTRSNLQYFRQWRAARLSPSHQAATMLLHLHRRALARFGFDPQSDPLQSQRPVAISGA